ncbi:hypothetical protein Hanom_Chr07g00606371 [Helianthus anomalus]
MRKRNQRRRSAEPRRRQRCLADDVYGFRSLEPRVSDFGSVLIKTTWCLGLVHFLDPILVRFRSTQLWFGLTSQHRSALIRVSLGLSSSAGLGAAQFNPVRLGITFAAKRMLLNMAPSKGCVWLWVQQWCSLTVYCCTACFYFGYRS